MQQDCGSVEMVAGGVRQSIRTIKHDNSIHNTAIRAIYPSVFT